MFTCENGSNTKFYTDSGTSRLEITHAGNVLVNTGELHIPDALAHLGDTDTKIRFPAADNISFEVAGVEAARFLPTSGGSGGPRMGLGTNNPTGMLHIYGTNPPLRIQNSNDSANLQMGMWDQNNIMLQASNRPFKLATETSHPIVFHTGGLNNERLRITANGEVGIRPGGLTPTAGDLASGDSQNTPLLHVRGSGSSDTGGEYNLLARFQAGGDSDGSGGMIVVNHDNDRGLAIQGGRRTGNYAHGALKMIDNIGRLSNAILIHGGAGQGVNNMGFYTGESATTTERLHISAAGRVGIGTNIPGQMVHLSSPSGSDGYFRADTVVNGGLLLYVSGTQRGVFANDSAFSGTTTDIGIAAKGNMLFRTGTSAYTERMRITTTGAVNIGGNYTQTSYQFSSRGGAVDQSAQFSNTKTGNGDIHYIGITLSSGSTGQALFGHTGHTTANQQAAWFGLGGDDVAGGTGVKCFRGGLVQMKKSGVCEVIINNNVTGHQFISQCSDNNNGFEIYQKHGSTATRNTLAVYANTGSSGAKELQFAVRGDGNIYSNLTRKAVSYTALQTPTYWTLSATGTSNQTIDVSSVFGVPDNAKAILVQGWYHVSGYSQGGVGQADHASSHFSEYQPSGNNPWGFYTQATTSWGQYVMDHDGDSSGSPLYYGVWAGQGVVNVNPNGNIYGRCFWGYSGGTHYNQLWCFGYYT